MAFKWLAKKLNIYCRDPTYITWADIIFTYIYIFSIIIILSYYIRNSYYIAQHDLSKCEKRLSHTSCLKTEVIHICVTKIGIIFSFSVAIYKFTDLTSTFINCMCCCYSLISKKEDSNNSEITIEINDFKKDTNDTNDNTNTQINSSVNV